jgi:hypothetical protein
MYNFLKSAEKAENISSLHCHCSLRKECGLKKMYLSSIINITPLFLSAKACSLSAALPGKVGERFYDTLEYDETATRSRVNALPERVYIFRHG